MVAYQVGIPFTKKLGGTMAHFSGFRPPATGLGEVVHTNVSPQLSDDRSNGDKSPTFMVFK